MFDIDGTSALTGSALEPGDAALTYATDYGWHVLPLCWPINDQRCGCGRALTDHKVGKAPLTRNGVDDATDDPVQIREWWRRWPRANVGIAFKHSALLVVAPDSPKWLAAFEQRGLPPTITVRSGGGAGHVHFYYARPDGCPIHRIARTGEYDLLSGGYVVVPPSRHKDGPAYEWVRAPWD
ncbi:MAG: bifunctional DNA primase/polymerase [Chloroflexi bacterium]|nr:bifunctional DNA primase/polymerase [Chloroflexota bacterium]